MRRMLLCAAALALLASRPSSVRATAQSPPEQGQATATGVSRAFNPAISVNALFLGALFNGEPIGHGDAGGAAGEEHGHGEVGEGLQIQEAELQLTSFVDPYFKGDLIIGMHGEAVEIEEAYVTSQALPAGLSLRIGRTYTPFGKHNRLHTHQFPFVEPPLVHSMLLGEEGLSEFGAELSCLVPVPFFLEAIAAIYNGDNEYFASANDRDLIGLGRLGALWDLSESTTLEAGGSYATGQSSWSNAYEYLAGGDLTLKWRPLRRALYTQAEWQLEYLHGSRLPEVGADGAFGGLATHVRYRFNRTWWLGVRYEKTGLPGEEDESMTRYAAQFAWVPGEFELWRLQYSLTEPDLAGAGSFGAIYLQMTFTIGSHPAHAY